MIKLLIQHVIMSNEINFSNISLNLDQFQNLKILHRIWFQLEVEVYVYFLQLLKFKQPFCMDSFINEFNSIFFVVSNGDKSFRHLL